jgi:RND family efflux transporter MFP subunit
MNNPWIKLLMFLFVIGVGVGGMYAVGASGEKEEEKQEIDTSPVVKIENAESMDYQVLIQSFGEVRPLESTKLSAQVSGEVISWNRKFVAGGLVERGEVLFSIEKDTYEAALLQAEAELTQAQAVLIEEQARAEVAQREAKNLPASKVSDLYLRKPQLLSAQASLKSAQAKIKIAQRDLRNCEVKSPYNALVISRDIGVGEFVNRGNPVGTINNIETAEIAFPIAGFDSAFLPATFENHQAMVVSKGVKTFSRIGKISRDIGIIDKSTRMSQLVVTVDDPYGLDGNLPALKFGSYVEISIPGQTLRNVYRLPQDLVTRNKVWVIDDENRMQEKSVEVIREEGSFFFVNSGIEANDRIVTTVPEYPQRGMKVRLASEVKDASLVAQQPAQ